MNTTDTPDTALDILSVRAAKYAALPDARLNRTIIDSVVVLRVGDQSFGIPSTALERIGRTPPIAHLPGLPRVVRGTLQNRGELLSAVDIAKWYRIDNAVGGDFFSVVVHSSGRKLALLIDSVIGFRDIAQEDLAESFWDKSDHEGIPLTATTRDLIAIIDVEQMFESPEIVSKSQNDNRR